MESERARPSFLSGHCSDFPFSGRKGRGIFGKCVPLAATAMACSGVPFSAPVPVLVGGPWREEEMRASARPFLFDKTEAGESRRRESERANPSFLSGHCSDFPFSGRKGRGIFGKCVPLAATAMACSGVPFSAPVPVLVGGPWREEEMRASARPFLFDKTEAGESRRRESERANPSFLSGHCSDFPFSGRKGRGIFGKCVPLAATAMACSGVPFSAPVPVLVGGPWREEEMRASARPFLFDKTEAGESRRMESERARPSFLSGHCSDFPFSGRKGRGIFGKCVPLAATAMACSGVPFSAPVPVLVGGPWREEEMRASARPFLFDKTEAGESRRRESERANPSFLSGHCSDFPFSGRKGGGSLKNASSWRPRQRGEGAPVLRFLPEAIPASRLRAHCTGRIVCGAGAVAGGHAPGGICRMAAPFQVDSRSMISEQIITRRLACSPASTVRSVRTAVRL